MMLNDLPNHKVTEKVLEQASMNDAQHIAIATVNCLDCLVSWNFKHPEIGLPDDRYKNSFRISKR